MHLTWIELGTTHPVVTSYRKVGLCQKRTQNRAETYRCVGAQHDTSNVSHFDPNVFVMIYIMKFVKAVSFHDYLTRPG
jgi:hypothetical protein